jgi:AcrR family transcriptional regulator
MANIAEAAGMSAGLIYRYFDSKNAIILAITERQLQESREGIAALHADASMGALATRDPQMAEALAGSDRDGA